MSIIKGTREKLGYTQVALANKTGLSLRTIQRLESSNKAPKGHSLTVLSAVFEIEPARLQDKFKSINRNKSSEINSIRSINLSVLSFLGCPFGNLIFPILLWRKNRHLKLVDAVGRRIINCQIIWSLVFSMLMIISPFASKVFFTNTPIILIVLVVFYITNIVIVGVTAIKLQRNNLNFLNTPIRFI